MGISKIAAIDSYTHVLELF